MKGLSDQYDHKALVKYTGTLVALVALYYGSRGYGALILPVLTILALVQRKAIWLMFWVMWLTMSSVGNNVIFSRNLVTMMVTRVTLVTLTFLVIPRVFSSRSSRPMMPFWGIIPYLLWECLSSLQGYEPVVSYLKLFLFFCIFLAMFGVVNEVNASTRVNAKIVRSAILSVLGMMIVGSVLLIPFPGLSQMVGEDAQKLLAIQAGEIVSLFCGMCSHSQAMGPLAGIAGTFIFADLVFSIKKWDRLYMFMLLCCVIICYKTSSRTGMGTFVAGCGMTTLLFLRSRGVGRGWKTKVMSLATGMAILGAVAIIAVPNLRQGATNFLLKTKSGEKQSLSFENITSSRAGAKDLAIQGLKRSPFLGNGFQVSWEMQYEHRSGLASYLAAPIEKGVWIYAIVEEGGIVGMILFCGWLLYLFPVLIKRHAYEIACVFFAFMVANMGEFCIFSMTYIGGFYWTMVLAAGALDVQRMKGQKIQVYNVPIEQVMQEVGMDEWVRVRG